MIDPACDCTVDQQARCATRAEPFHNRSTFKCKARTESTPDALGENKCCECGATAGSWHRIGCSLYGFIPGGPESWTLLIARLGTIRNIAEGGLSERSLPEIARLAKEALQIAGSSEPCEQLSVSEAASFNKALARSPRRIQEGAPRGAGSKPCECLVRDKEPSAYHNVNCPRYVADLL